MAPLALGRVIVTNLGPASEPVWARAGALEFTEFTDHEATLRRIESLIARPQRRRWLGERARELYTERFSWLRTLSTLTRRRRAELARAATEVGFALSGD
jgi:glycosyltransferase involved in cell wall biosynthesis